MDGRGMCKAGPHVSIKESKIKSERVIELGEGFIRLTRESSAPEIFCHLSEPTSPACVNCRRERKNYHEGDRYPKTILVVIECVFKIHSQNACDHSESTSHERQKRQALDKNIRQL